MGATGTHGCTTSILLHSFCEQKARAPPRLKGREMDPLVLWGAGLLLCNGTYIHRLNLATFYGIPPYIWENYLQPKLKPSLS